jgi:uncharacterized protein (DUF1501 family)
MAVGDPADALHSEGEAFRSAAERVGALLAQEQGPPLVLLDSYGWDTHADQGAHAGRLALALENLAAGLIVLAATSGNAWRHTVVLVTTEFGRSVGMNASGGTDHGTARATFVLGGAVAGGRVIGPWPGAGAGAPLPGA